MANCDEARVNAVAEKCWWRYTSKRKLVEEFNLTEEQIDELRKTPQYRSKVLELMVAQRRSRAEFEKWIKHYDPNFDEWLGRRMGLDPEVVSVMVEEARQFHVDIASGRAKAPKVIHNPDKVSASEVEEIGSGSEKEQMVFDTLNIPSLGKLGIIETYAYYDQPVLFSCKNSEEHLYLVVAADENDQYETWLYVVVSPERLTLIRSGAIDLHDAFADPEDGCLLQAQFSYDAPTSPRIESIEANQVSEDMLPFPGECLDLETETCPTFSKTEPMPKNNQNLDVLPSEI